MVNKEYYRRNQALEDLLISEYKQRHQRWINNTELDTRQIDPGYSVLITDQSVQSPFMISSQLIRIIRENTRTFQSKEDKSRAIYNWIERNVNYGKIGSMERYINSEEVLRYRRGICAEMTFLYTAMARSIGLKSSFTSVDVDCFGQSVQHACAQVETEKGKILADPAYHMYDVRHRHFRVWTDKEVINTYSQLRRR